MLYSTAHKRDILNETSLSASTTSNIIDISAIRHLAVQILVSNASSLDVMFQLQGTCLSPEDTSFSSSWCDLSEGGARMLGNDVYLFNLSEQGYTQFRVKVTFFSGSCDARIVFNGKER